MGCVNAPLAQELFSFFQDAVLEHLATKGPLAVAVAANPWFSYSSGVFDGCSFDRNIEINHGTTNLTFKPTFKTATHKIAD